MSRWASQGLIREVVGLCCSIAIASMWNLLAGYAGLVAVGQQAFVGVAAPAMSVMPSPGVWIPSRPCCSPTLAPAILAVPTYGLLHRLDGLYSAIGTWVIAEVLRLATPTFGYVKAGAAMARRTRSAMNQAVRRVTPVLRCSSSRLTRCSEQAMR